MRQMQLKVDEILNDTAHSSPLKYWIYSVHDTQISNLMYWLHSSNAQVDYVEFASQVIFELLFD